MCLQLYVVVILNNVYFPATNRGYRRQCGVTEAAERAHHAAAKGDAHHDLCQTSCGGQEEGTAAFLLFISHKYSVLNSLSFSQDEYINLCLEHIESVRPNLYNITTQNKT